MQKAMQKSVGTGNTGEYLTALHIEQTFRKWELWIPRKDWGADLLVSSRTDRRKNAALQVKYSKDHLTLQGGSQREQYRSKGWWTFSFAALEKNIKDKAADFWILSIERYDGKTGLDCVIIQPKELHRRLKRINTGNTQQTYLWITHDNRCFATRGLRKAETNLLDAGDYRGISTDRDFTPFLNNWKELEQRLGTGR